MITVILFLVCFLGLVLPYDYFSVASNMSMLPFIWHMFTHQLGHANWQHLAGNFMFMAPFAAYLEAKLGPKTFLKLFFACGVFAALTEFLLGGPGSLIGASGAASGVAGAACVLYGRAAWDRILAYGLMAFLFFPEVIAAVTAKTHIAHWAHVGGLIAGALIALVITNRNPNRP